MAALRKGLPRLAPEKALSHLANDAYMEEGESHNQIAAIHRDDGTAQVVAGMRSQEDAAALHVVRGAPAVSGNALGQLVVTLLGELGVLRVGQATFISVSM